jgi:hypothetical protein
VLNKEMALKIKDNIDENNLDKIEIEYSEEISDEETYSSCKEILVVSIDPSLSG